MRNIELPISCQLFVFFFQLIVFVNENTKNKMIFATQFDFYLMVLFVRAANKGKVTHGKTPAYFIYLVHFCTIVSLVGVM